jgi:hypothetical protein
LPVRRVRRRIGLEWQGTTIVARGSSAPNLLGKFNDKTSIEVDRTGGACDGNVYFSWSRFTGNGGVGIYFVRSTDHGVSFSNPIKLPESIHDVQFPDIAVDGNGHVYVAFREFAAQGQGQDAIWIAKSTNCGQTFAPPTRFTTFIRSDAIDQADPEAMARPQLQPDDPSGEEEGDAPGGLARDCGDFDAHCTSGYTFFRRDTQVRATADQLDQAHECIYMVYDATKPGTLAPTGTTYGTVGLGTGGQAATFFLRYGGRSSCATAAPVPATWGRRSSTTSRRGIRCSRTSRPTAVSYMRSGGTAGWTAATASQGRSATVRTEQRSRPSTCSRPSRRTPARRGRARPA